MLEGVQNNPHVGCLVRRTTLDYYDRPLSMGPHRTIVASKSEGPATGGRRTCGGGIGQYLKVCASRNNGTPHMPARYHNKPCQRLRLCFAAFDTHTLTLPLRAAIRTARNDTMTATAVSAESDLSSVRKRDETRWLIHRNIAADVSRCRQFASRKEQSIHLSALPSHCTELAQGLRAEICHSSALPPPKP